MILDEIIQEKKREIERTKEMISQEELIKHIKDAKLDKRLFKAAISLPNKVNLIAELKKASPSKGVIREDFDPVAIAKIYEENGVAALSVLTEKKFFQGDPLYIKEVKKAVSMPILRKDFIIDEYQIYESAYLGADAFLLIAALLDESKLNKFISTGKQLDLDALVEVHDYEDLQKALSAPAEIIGINNRNLKTLEVDIQTTKQLIGDIPKDKVIVSESGIESRQDYLFLNTLGVNALLIGEAFMKSSDISAKIKEITGHT